MTLAGDSQPERRMAVRLARGAVLVLALIALADRVSANPMHERNDGRFAIRFLHTNDMHSRFEETSRRSTACSPKDKAAGKCYGGFARIATLVRKARDSNVPALFLNAGDTYQGTVWYNVYKWEAVVKFMNLLEPDAVSLGNHEFDDGVAGLVPFIEKANFPIVAANLDLSQEPRLQASRLLRSTVLVKAGQKIGVIGYLTPETQILSTTEKVIFEDEVESVRREARLLREQGVKILVALGHSGYETDKRIAAEVEDIDLVIGGHTNTFLYDGDKPDLEIPEGLYPTEVLQKSGRKTYVVQAYAYTKYLGDFTAVFDEDGEVVDVQGNPVLVNGSIPQAADVLKLIGEMKPKVDNVTNLEVGKTRVLLDGDSKTCRREECNLGNLITDAMIDYNARQYFSKSGWTDAPIAVQNGGSIRSSITRDNDDKITYADVLGTLPFGNTLVKVSMTGEQIISMLEWSVKSLANRNDTSNLNGAFLQFSGLQVVYDLRKPEFSRVVSVLVQCAACRVPNYSELRTNATYSVLMNDFIQAGGDGFSMLKNLTATPLDIETVNVVTDYLEKRSPIHTGVEWRITFDTSSKEQSTDNAAVTYHSFTIMIFMPVIGWLLS